MRTVKKLSLIALVGLIVTFIGGTMILSAPPVAQAAGGTLTDNCNKGFLGFPSWYRGLTVSDTDPSQPTNCNIKSPNSSGGLSGFIWMVALNVTEMAVVAGAYLSGFLFLYGGWMFIISRGNPEGAAKARSIMTMAGLGLVLLVSAVTLVNFIVDKVIV